MSKTFYYNGVKDSDGKLVKAHYSDAMLVHYPEGTITIYVRSILDHFPQLEGLTAENDTELLTDYFDSDKVRITPDNPWYPEVAAALQQQKNKRAKRYGA
jgi:hypothetical protein